MNADVDAIYQKILKVAQNKDITCYSDIAPLVNLDMGSPGDRTRMANILGEISRYEHANERPLLSAAIVLREQNIPGRGFFNLARELGLYHGDDDLQFWMQELKRVYNYWGS